MTEHLPIPSVEIPGTTEGIRARLIEHSSRYKRGRERSDRDEYSYDKRTIALQALSNCNKLLDFYPNGSPRDHLAAYAYDEGYSDTEEHEKIPQNIEMGED